METTRKGLLTLQVGHIIGCQGAKAFLTHAARRDLQWRRRERGCSRRGQGVALHASAHAVADLLTRVSWAWMQPSKALCGGTMPRALAL